MAEDPNAAVDPNAVADPSATVQNVVTLIVMVVRIAAAPWAILAVQKPALEAIRISVEASVQTVAVQNAVAQNAVVARIVARIVVAESRFPRGFFRASLLPRAKLV